MPFTWVSEIARGSVAAAGDADLDMLSAAVAYYGLVSIFPLALLALVAASLVGEAAANTVAETFAAGAAPSLRPLLRDTIDAGAGAQGTATAVSIVLLAWSASRVFAAIDQAFRQIHEVDERWGRLGRPIAATVVLGSVTLVVIALSLISFGLRLFGLPHGDLVKAGVSIVAVAVGLSPLYAVMSGTRIGVRDVLPGATVAAVGLASLRAGFEFYVARSGVQDLYGIVGGVLLFALWLYLGAAVVLFGACVNRAVADATDGDVT